MMRPLISWCWQPAKVFLFRPANRWSVESSSRSRQRRRLPRGQAAMFSRTWPRRTPGWNSFTLMSHPRRIPSHRRRLKSEMAHSIAAGFGEMAEAVRAADVASAGPWRKQSPKIELFRPANHFSAKPASWNRQGRRTSRCRWAAFSSVWPRRDAQGEQFRAAGEFPTTHNRSNETSASQHVSQPAWGD